MLGEDKYKDSLANFRSALQQCLEGIARQIAGRRGEQVPVFAEDGEVRDYLQEKGFFTKEERRGFSGIYGLLSSGAHGEGDRNLALLGYAACIMACHYAIAKFRGLQDEEPRRST
jgi:predicted ATP-grasp superfamily ATP-dependent carboligase